MSESDNGGFLDFVAEFVGIVAFIVMMPIIQCVGTLAVIGAMIATLFNGEPDDEAQ
ncbi:MAG: hypothetical protein ACPGPS_04030 [Rubripirellula sp.]